MLDLLVNLFVLLFAFGFLVWVARRLNLGQFVEIALIGLCVLLILLMVVRGPLLIF